MISLGLHSSIGPDELEASIKSSCNAVELEECLREFEVRVHPEEMEALDLILSRAESSVDPLPCDLVAIRNVDGDRILYDRWVALRSCDECLLRWNSRCAKLRLC